VKLSHIVKRKWSELAIRKGSRVVVVKSEMPFDRNSVWRVASVEHSCRKVRGAKIPFLKCVLRKRGRTMEAGVYGAHSDSPNEFVKWSEAVERRASPEGVAKRLVKLADTSNEISKGLTELIRSRKSRDKQAVVLKELGQL